MGELAERMEEWSKLPMCDKLKVLRSIRKASGLSLTEVAKKAGVSVPYLSLLERGKHNTVRTETLGRIAEACGCFLRVEIINARSNTFYTVYLSTGEK